MTNSLAQTSREICRVWIIYQAAKTQSAREKERKICNPTEPEKERETERKDRTRKRKRDMKIDI